jgi:phosphoribosylformylglycinamidine cyclo-ligase
VLLEGDDPLPLDGPFGDGTLADALLTPTRIYAPGLAAVRALDGAVHAASHITGGGLPGNLPRVLPAGTRAQVRPGAIPAPAIFDLVAERGDVAPEEMAKTFNLGVGMVLVVDAAREAEVREALEAVGETPLDLGEVHAA